MGSCAHERNIRVSSFAENQVSLKHRMFQKGDSKRIHQICVVWVGGQ